MAGIFDKLFSGLKKEPLNPEVFDDPVALVTSWEPAKRGGANFKTRRLVQDGSNILFKPTVTSILFPLIFIGIGIALPVKTVYDGGNIDPLLLLLPLMFCGIGGVFLYSTFIPITFDGREKLFWRGRTDPKTAIRQGKKVEYTRFDSIHAVQIISEWVRSSGKNSSSYYSYELNLVLKDGSRVNVIDHGKLSDIRSDAELLGTYLSVPIWDGSDR